jgi:polysaccharide export outer membrane protein
LQPGDVVTIVSQADIPVPLAEQTKYIRLEGEFVGAGVYSVRPGEDLQDVVRRAGGPTAAAYLYGSSFQRESARLFQQQRLDEYISTLSTDMERSAAVRAASSSSGILDPNALGEQRTLVAQLRQLRATGRIVLEFQANTSGIESIPKIALENGDVFRIPSRPNTVSVIGAVYGQNVFLFDSKRHLGDYVTLAGKPNRIADRKHAFIIRADGSIFSRERAQGAFSNHFEDAAINPGDSIVIPEKLIKPTALKNLLDYSQVLSSFGLAAAAINVVQ